MTSNLATDIEAARRVSTPLLGIQTADQSDTLARLLPVLGKTVEGEVVPLLEWDSVRGLRALSPTEETILARNAMLKSVNGQEAAFVNPVTMLDAAHLAPKDTLIILYNAHLAMTDPLVRQALWNLRDPFKRNARSILLLGRMLSIPSELEGDVIVFDDPLPDREQAAELILQTFKDADVPEPPPAVLESAVDSVRGLSPFAIEQNSSLSLTPETISVPSLQDRRCVVIKQTRGLSVLDGPESFESIGGCENAKTFFRRVIAGRSRPTAGVFIDEIEKAMGGSSGDSSGTSQDQLMQLLTFMQDHRATGVILIGPPGCAKSAIAKAFGNEAGIPTIQFDLGAMKGSLVGQSEERIREALRVVHAVSDGRAMFIATCNKISDLPPELRRRFKFGTFFFSLPTAAEREAIWAIYVKKYDLADAGPKPNDAGWTGAEIEQCCELAWQLKTTLRDAGQYVVPVTVSAGDKITNLCREADGKFISASDPGIYRYRTEEVVAPSPGRKINVAGRG